MLLNPLCACVILVYIPLAKASHMVKPKVRVGGLYSHWQRVQVDWVGVENWGQFFKPLHHGVMAQRQLFLNNFKVKIQHSANYTFNSGLNKFRSIMTYFYSRVPMFVYC